MEKAAFRDYFTITITKELESNPEKDVKTIKVDLKLSTLKPIHAKLMNEIYKHFKQSDNFEWVEGSRGGSCRGGCQEW